MTKIKYNVKGVESRGERAIPKPGVYRAKITSLVDATPSGKDRRLEAQYTIQGGDYDGFVLYDYINMVSDAAAWKFRQFLEAVGLVTDKKEAGTLDTDALVGTALSVKTKVQAETDAWPASAKVALLMPLDGADDDDEDLSDDPDTDDEDGETSDDDDLWTEEELEALSTSDLKDAAMELEVEVPDGKMTAQRKAKLIAAILEAQEPDEGDEGDEGDDAEGGDEDDEDADDEAWTEDELNELDDEDLVLYAYGGEDSDGDEVEGVIDEDEMPLEQFQTKKKKGKKTVTVLDRDGLIAAFLEAQGGDDDDDDDDDGEDPIDYDAMDLDELKKLAGERKLSAKGSKKVIIARLQKDDAPF